MDEWCQDATIISGVAKGVDSIAVEWAIENDLPVLRFAAEWFKYGGEAGFIRNHQMVREGRPDLVIAFQYPGYQTPGTSNMISIARAANIPVLIFTD